MVAALLLVIALQPRDAAATPGVTRPHVGVTMGYEMNAACPGDLFGQAPSRCQRPLFEPYNRDDIGWWYNSVEEIDHSGADFVAMTSRGCLDCLGYGPYEGNGNLCPRHLEKLVRAIRNSGSPLKVAMFDDTAAYRGARDRCEGTGGARFDLARDPGDGTGVFKYFWDKHWKPFFQTVPDDLRYKIDGRPVIVTWIFSDALFKNQEGNISRLVKYLRHRCRVEFGFDPYIVIHKSALSQDSTLRASRDVEGVHAWFSPNRSGATSTRWKDKSFGIAVPGFRDFPASRMDRVLPRAHGATYAGALARLKNDFFVMIEGHTDVAESAGMYRSTLWDYPNQYLNILREFTKPDAEQIRFQAEAYDEAGDTTPGNGGGAYRSSGDADVSPSDGGMGWHVGDTAAGEWLRFADVKLGDHRYWARLRYKGTREATVVVRIGTVARSAKLPASPTWSDFVMDPIDVAAGRYPVTIDFRDGGVALDWAELSIRSAPTLPPGNAAPGDYDGDGRIDRAIVDLNTGRWYVIGSRTSSITGVPGIPWGWQWAGMTSAHRLALGDYDGDGRTDRAIVDPNSGQWYVIGSRTPEAAGVPGIPWGWQWAGMASVHRLALGDYDGDGRTDRAIVDPNGRWYVIGSQTGGVPGIAWGWQWAGMASSHRLALGDYDGDRRTDRAIVDPNGRWYVIGSRTGGLPDIPWGWQWAEMTSQHQLAPGDYDGDGRADRAIVDPNTGRWSVVGSWTP